MQNAVVCIQLTLRLKSVAKEFMLESIIFDLISFDSNVVNQMYLIYYI